MRQQRPRRRAVLSNDLRPHISTMHMTDILEKKRYTCGYCECIIFPRGFTKLRNCTSGTGKETADLLHLASDERDSDNVGCEPSQRL